MKRKKPKILSCEEKSILTAYQNKEYYNCHFKENIDKNIEISDTTFDSCIFTKIDFTNIKFTNVDFVDVIFEECDLSNKKFDKQLLSRVNFKNCKMIGVSFIDSSLKDTEFTECITKYLNFSGAKLNNVLFQTFK